jgi:surfeit locus 1 family protein
MTRRAIIATLMTAIMLPVLFGLGLWQWQRLAWKEALIISLKAADDARPKVLDETFPSKSWAEFDRVEAKGIFDHAQEQRVWTASEGRTGWRIITPMFFERPAPGDHMCNFPPAVYVERGMEPGNIPRKSDRPLGKVEVAGRLFRSETSQFVASGSTRPGEWTLADLPAMAKTLHPLGAQCRTAFATPEAVRTNVLPLLLVAANQTGFDLPVPQKREIVLANRHFEYALTWWSFAGILFVIWVLFLRGELRRAKPQLPADKAGRTV